MSRPAPRWAVDLARLIGDDIAGRKGLGNEWDEIDSEIKEEILLTWAQIIAMASYAS